MPKGKNLDRSAWYHEHHGLRSHSKIISHELKVKDPDNDVNADLRGEQFSHQSTGIQQDDFLPNKDSAPQNLRDVVKGPVPEEREEPPEYAIGSWIDWAWSRSDKEIQQFIHSLLQVKMGEIALAENASERTVLDRKQEQLIREYSDIRIPR